MAYATQSLLHVSTLNRRNALPRDRQGFRALGRGLLFLLGWITAGLIVLTAAAWLLATALHARSNIRTSTALGTSSAQLLDFGVAARGMPSQEVSLAGLAPPQAQASIETIPARDIFAQPATETLDQKRVDPVTTGSAPPNARLDSEQPAAFAIAPAGDNSRVLPMPRARPKVASLQPPTDMGLKPTEETRPARTAIYDISAQTVYLPNGERLEAHSGLGSMMDKPSYVHLRMRGATPPHTYKLTMREALFHGVEAIRMTPVGDGNMFGRAGILAHTYMLGPNGQSNGCVSFKNYPRFLQAFKRGEIDRMVVVSRLDRAPTSVARRATERGDENAL